MHKILITIIASLVVSGCGTTHTFSASSSADLNELYASCVGPHGSFEIGHDDSPFIYMSIRRKEGVTEIYFYRDPKLKSGDIIWPENAKFTVDGREVLVSESGELGKSILQEGTAYFHYPDTPDKLSFELGEVYFNQVKVSVERIDFTYEKRRFLMCVQ